MNPQDILHEEQKVFFAKLKEYAQKHSTRDKDGNRIYVAGWTKVEPCI